MATEESDPLIVPKKVVMTPEKGRTVAAVHAEPERVAGEQALVVHKVDHVSPCVAGDEEADRKSVV